MSQIIKAKYCMICKFAVDNNLNFITMKTARFFQTCIRHVNSAVVDVAYWLSKPDRGSSS